MTEFAMTDSTTTTNKLELERDAFGKLRLRVGAEKVTVTPVRSFPISAPDEGVALMGPDGKERAWIEHLDHLPAAQRALINAELAGREFIPEIRRIFSISSVATPSTWDIETDRGHTTLVLKGEEDIRRLPGGALLISDHAGVQFLLRQVSALDKADRRLLDHFL
jgi:hypothetical protein